jgi:integrase
VTVRKRKDTGSWITDFTHNGERIQRVLKYARTRSEAEQAEAVIMTKVFQQAYGFENKQDTLFENFIIENFLPYSKANKKSYYCDKLICRGLVKHFKGKTLRQITPPLIESFKQEFLAKPIVYGPEGDKKERKRSPTTVNYHLAILSKIFSLAVDADLIEVNPSFRVKKLKMNNQRLRVLSAEEEAYLFQGLSGNELVTDIVTLALHTGLRRGEIFNLRWFDIDFARRFIQVQESKSGKKRLVPMNETVLGMLGQMTKTSELVFPSPKTGDKLDNVRRSFKRAVEGAGIKDFHFHDLRHTFATRMADKGADPFTLMKILGHSDIRMTSRYTHATDNALHRAVANLVANPLQKSRTSVPDGERLRLIEKA